MRIEDNGVALEEKKYKKYVNKSVADKDSFAARFIVWLLRFEGAGD